MLELIWILTVVITVGIVASLLLIAWVMMLVFMIREDDDA